MKTTKQNWMLSSNTHYAQTYNGKSAPQLSHCISIALRTCPISLIFPTVRKRTKIFRLYTNAMKEVAANNHILFIDAFKHHLRIGTKKVMKH
ncbi:MAG: hypothetical protein U5K54_19520 [Cytophagales bacterium]|nr:hypothetical protein [Cytophagales bacterium]